MSVRVSVVVPVYNPGSYLDPLLVSFGRQLRLRSLEWSDGVPRLDLVADMFDAASQPVRFERHPDGTVAWLPPGTVADHVPTGALAADGDLAATSVSVVLRGADATLAYDVPAVVDRVLRDTPDGPVLSIRAHVDIDPRTAAAGTELPAGDWEVFADVRSCGWHSMRRVGMAGEAQRRPMGFRVTSEESIELAAAVPAGRGGTAPVRRPSGRHAIERLVPRPVLRRIPLPARQAAKRLLLRMGDSRRDR